eukprot:747922-Hanusia_phi.AAC.1
MSGQGREELFTLLHEQQQINKDLEETVNHYKDLHNKSELGTVCEEVLLPASHGGCAAGLRKHEDLLRTELLTKIQASELEISRLLEMHVCSGLLFTPIFDARPFTQDKKLSSSLIRKAQALEASGVIVVHDDQQETLNDIPAAAENAESRAADKERQAWLKRSSSEAIRFDICFPANAESSRQHVVKPAEMSRERGEKLADGTDVSAREMKTREKRASGHAEQKEEETQAVSDAKGMLAGTARDFGATAAKPGTLPPSQLRPVPTSRSAPSLPVIPGFEHI